MDLSLTEVGPLLLSKLWLASKSELFGLSVEISSPSGANPIPIPFLPPISDPNKFAFSFLCPNIGLVNPGMGLGCGTDWRFVGENCEKLGTCCPPAAIPGTTHESCMFLMIIGSLFLLVLPLNFFDGGGSPKWVWPWVGEGESPEEKGRLPPPLKS